MKPILLSVLLVGCSVSEPAAPPTKPVSHHANAHHRRHVSPTPTPAQGAKQPLQLEPTSTAPKFIESPKENETK